MRLTVYEFQQHNDKVIWKSQRTPFRFQPNTCVTIEKGGCQYLFWLRMRYTHKIFMGDNSYNRQYAPRQDEFQKRNICSILFSKHLSAILRNNYLPQEKGLSEEVKQYKLKTNCYLEGLSTQINSR